MACFCSAKAHSTKLLLLCISSSRSKYLIHCFIAFITNGYLHVSLHIAQLLVRLWVPRVHFRNDKCNCSQGVLAKSEAICCSLNSPLSQGVQSVLPITYGIQIGQPYMVMGLISESNSFMIVLRFRNFQSMIFLSAWYPLFALRRRSRAAFLKLPANVKMIPK